MTPSTLFPAIRSAAAYASLIACALVAGCGGGEEPASADPIRPVRTAEAETADGRQTRAFAGQTQAPVASQLSFKVAGTVTRRPVKVGEAVRAGALVAALDATDYQIQVQEAEAALLEARARVQNAEAEYGRIRGLYAEDLVARSRFDAAQTQRQTSRAALAAAEQRLALAEKRLGYTRLHAPEAGAVAAVHVEPGENVQAGQPVVRLATGGALEVEISVPEGRIGQITEGDTARVTLAAVPGAALRAVVTEVGVAPGPSATAYPVVARLLNAIEGLRPGMAARVAFAFGGVGPVEEGEARLAVPPEAVSRDRQGRPFVYVVAPLPADSAGAGEAAATPAPDGVAQRRAVEVGPLTPQGLEIRGGLRAGERVVTAGLADLTDGQLVRF